MQIQVNDFSLSKTLECGQIFRYTREEGGYSLIAGDRQIHIRQEGSILDFPSESSDFVMKYFSLDVDYSVINKSLLQDSTIASAIEISKGIRILQQDSFETIISFVTSQQNNIPRIKNLLNRLACEHGTHFLDYNAFPTIEQLKSIPKVIYESYGFGYRSKYLVSLVSEISPEMLNSWHSLTTPELLRALMALPGIGIKVASCVALYAYQRYDVFPIDVWVRRIMQNRYFNDHAVSDDIIYRFARERFGKYCGIAQQYFYYEGRNH